MKKPYFPVRTANLPAIITDGGFFLVLIYITIFISLSDYRILKNLNSINRSNFLEITNLFLNKGLIISFIFFLNYINYNLDCTFIYMILINPIILQNLILMHKIWIFACGEPHEIDDKNVRLH